MSTDNVYIYRCSPILCKNNNIVVKKSTFNNCINGSITIIEHAKRADVSLTNFNNCTSWTEGACIYYLASSIINLNKICVTKSQCFDKNVGNVGFISMGDLYPNISDISMTNCGPDGQSQLFVSHGRVSISNINETDCQANKDAALMINDMPEVNVTFSSFYRVNASDWSIVTFLITKGTMRNCNFISCFTPSRGVVFSFSSSKITVIDSSVIDNTGNGVAFYKDTNCEMTLIRCYTTQTVFESGIDTIQMKTDKFSNPFPIIECYQGSKCLVYPLTDEDDFIVKMQFIIPACYVITEIFIPGMD